MARRREVFTQKDGATITEPRQVSELVSGIGLGDRVGARWNLVAGEHG